MHLGALVTDRLVGGDIFPASEKTHSDGADVAGMARYLHASTAVKRISLHWLASNAMDLRFD